MRSRKKKPFDLKASLAMTGTILGFGAIGVVGIVGLGSLATGLIGSVVGEGIIAGALNGVVAVGLGVPSLALAGYGIYKGNEVYDKIIDNKGKSELNKRVDAFREYSINGRFFIPVKEAEKSSRISRNIMYLLGNGYVMNVRRNSEGIDVYYLLSVSRDSEGVREPQACREVLRKLLRGVGYFEEINVNDYSTHTKCQKAIDSILREALSPDNIVGGWRLGLRLDNEGNLEFVEVLNPRF